MMENEHYYIFFFNKLKKIMKIYCNLGMNLKVLLELHQKVTNIIFDEIKIIVFVFTVDITELQRTFNSIKARINNAQTDLDSAKTDSTPEDLFVQTIEVCFQKVKKMNVYIIV